MPSTSTSNALVEARKLSLAFDVDVHRQWTLKDVFARFASQPLKTILAKRERIQVARDLDFTISRGERVALLGVNGAGKTSLCRCIAGVYGPTSGSVRVQGNMRAIFAVGTGIHPELTGRENVDLLCRFLYPGNASHEKIVEEALAFSELGDFVDVPYRLYSSGMQARLCLSVASAESCDFLILDEVFDGADAFFSEKISSRFVSLIERSGAALFVSHSPDQIRRVCNRAIILRDGAIVFDGGVEEGLERYRELGPRAPQR